MADHDGGGGHDCRDLDYDYNDGRGGDGNCRCYDATPANPSPPQGLQLVLKEPSQWATPAAEAVSGSGNTTAAGVGGASSGGGGGAPLTDTVVMNNLGYFQLQASPGVRSRNEKK